MITREEYRAWADRFATVQGLRFEDDLQMVYSWYRALWHYTLDELNDAAREITKSTKPAPRDKSDYRAWIHRLILTARSVQMPASVVEEMDRGTCTICLGSGLAIVPHVRCVHLGEWVPLKIGDLPATFHTLAVWCSCRLGGWRQGRFQVPDRKTYRVLSLEEYERFNPHWRRQMATKADADLAEIRLQAAEQDRRRVGTTPAKLIEDIGRMPE